MHMVCFRYPEILLEAECARCRHNCRGPDRVCQHITYNIWILQQTGDSTNGVCDYAHQLYPLRVACACGLSLVRDPLE